MKSLFSKYFWLALAIGGSLNASAVNVTFRINMSVQTAMAQFDPANDYVYVSGTFNSWSPNATLLSPSPTNADIWEATVDLTAGSWPNYKFIKYRSGSGTEWEADGVGPGGSKNRYVQVPSADAALDVVYFNNITEVVNNHAPVTFQINMGVQIAQGAFDPASGTLTVSGDVIDNWVGNTHTLTQSLVDTNLYAGTWEITNGVGSAVSFKYIMNGTWESIANRSFVMTNIAQTLPVVYFNNVTNVAVPIDLTFSVNMGVAMARGVFNPSLGDFVEVRGSFLTSGGTWIGGFSLTNETGNPLIYSGTFTDTNDAPGGTVLYQFVVNNTTWESSGNRSFTLTSTNPVVRPVVYLNDIGDLGSITNTPVSPTSAIMSWNGGPAIRLQTRTNLTSGAWTDVVPDTTGLSSSEVILVPDQTYFRLIGP